MIVLRPFAPDDAERVLSLLNDEEVVRYLSSRINYPYTFEDADWWVREGSHLSPTWAIVAPKEDEIVGCIGLQPRQFEESHSAEIGYWIGKPYWGLGYVTDALAQVTESSLGADGIIRLTAGVFQPNTASMKVLEKCGYVLESVFEKGYRKHSRYYDKYQYVKILNREYEDRNAEEI